MSTRNAFPKAFRALHVSGRPTVFTNVYDAVTAPAVLDLPSVKAIATASYAVAAAARFKDDDMTLETNFAAILAIASVAEEFQKPLGADWQNSYGDRLEDGIKAIVDQGVVGINLEDCGKES